MRQRRVLERARPVSDEPTRERQEGERNGDAPVDHRSAGAARRLGDLTRLSAEQVNALLGAYLVLSRLSSLRNMTRRVRAGS